MNRRTPLKRTASKRRRKPVSPASPAQKAKVARIGACIVCGSQGTAFAPLDPAHLIDRSLGGCDEADCVVPLCRRDHDLYDEHALDLSSHLEPRFRAEAAHAVMHVGLWRALRRISGDRNRGSEAA